MELAIRRWNEAGGEAGLGRKSVSVFWFCVFEPGRGAEPALWHSEDRCTLEMHLAVVARWRAKPREWVSLPGKRRWSGKRRRLGTTEEKADR